MPPSRGATFTVTQDSLPALDIEHFDGTRIARVVREVARHYRVRTAFLAMESSSNLQLRARHGITLRVAPLTSIARHQIARDLPVIIESIDPDDDCFREDPVVVGPPRMSFFAGAPLITPQLICVGNLVIMDEEPRPGFSLLDCAMLTASAKSIMSIYRAAVSTAELWKLPVPSMDCLPSMSPSSASVSLAARSAAQTVQTLESLPSRAIESFDNIRVQEIVGRVANHYEVAVAFMAMETPTGLKLCVRHGIDVPTVPLSSVARHTVHRDLPVIIGDTEKLRSLDTDELVAGPPRLRFVARTPLMARPNVCVGALVIMDFAPRETFGLEDCTELVNAAKSIMNLYNAMAVSGDFWMVPLPSAALMPDSSSALESASTTKTQSSLPDLAVELFSSSQIVEIMEEVVRFYNVSGACLAIESPGCLKLRARFGIEASVVPHNSIARHCVARDLPIIIEDTLQDDDYARDELVLGPPLRRFFAGAPLMLKPGLCIGSMIIMDEEPRQGMTLSDCEFLVHSARRVLDLHIAAMESGRRTSLLSAASLPFLDEVLEDHEEHYEQVERLNSMDSVGSLGAFAEPPATGT